MDVDVHLLGPSGTGQSHADFVKLFELLESMAQAHQVNSDSGLDRDLLSVLCCHRLIITEPGHDQQGPQRLQPGAEARGRREEPRGKFSEVC